VPNEVVVQVGSDGYVDFANNSNGTVQLVVDISGYFINGSGAKFVPITPERVPRHALRPEHGNGPRRERHGHPADGAGLHRRVPAR
jgi:hypothetical protein